MHVRLGTTARISTQLVLLLQFGEYLHVPVLLAGAIVLQRGQTGIGLLLLDLLRAWRIRLTLLLPVELAHRCRGHLSQSQTLHQRLVLPLSQHIPILFIL